VAVGLGVVGWAGRRTRRACRCGVKGAGVCAHVNKRQAIVTGRASVGHCLTASWKRLVGRYRVVTLLLGRRSLRGVSKG